jgi:hypothetical protein
MSQLSLWQYNTIGFNLLSSCFRNFGAFGTSTNPQKILTTLSSFLSLSPSPSICSSCFRNVGVFGTSTNIRPNGVCLKAFDVFQSAQSHKKRTRRKQQQQPHQHYENTESTTNWR